jgi:hypothetical protein
MNRVVHFEIQADDVERAATFYRTVFGWEIVKWGSPVMEYWFVMTGPKDTQEPGIHGGLLKRQTPLAEKQCGANAFVCTIQVESFDATAEKILANGGALAMPKFALPGMAWQGYFLDTEKNVFGIHQPDISAA